MRTQPWYDEDTFLWFLQGDDVPRFMDLASLTDIYIGDMMGSTWECAYCGSAMSASALQCTACNAPRRTRTRRASARITGLLPQAAWLNAVTDGFTLEIRRTKWNPAWYDQSMLVARLTDCAISEKFLPMLVKGIYHEGDTPIPLELIVDIEGNFSFADAEWGDDDD